MNAWSIDITKILLPAEIKAVRQDLDRKAPRSVNTRQNRTVFLLATCYGLRCSEIRQLCLMDVKCDIPQPFINLRKAITKRKKSRRVLLSIDVASLEQIRAWKAERVSMGGDNKSPFVCSIGKGGVSKSPATGPGSTFKTRRGPGHPLARSATAARFKTACGVLGKDRVNSLSIHCGRHTCASILLHKGMSPARVQQIMGHSNIATTSAYLHVIPDADEKTDYFSDM